MPGSQRQERDDCPRLAEQALAVLATCQVRFYLGNGLIFQDSQGVGVNLVFDMVVVFIRSF